MVTMTQDEYYLNIALAVKAKANCKGSQVGAVLVVDNRIISTGYNGTAEGTTNCLDGGCVRCKNRDSQYPSGTAYDICICVHAEQNAILSAARFGIKTENSTMYTTMQPCFNCSKAMLQAKVSKIIYIEAWSIQNTWKAQDPDLHQQYLQLLKSFEHGVHQINFSPQNL